MSHSIFDGLPAEPVTLNREGDPLGARTPTEGSPTAVTASVFTGPQVAVLSDIQIRRAHELAQRFQANMDSLTQNPAGQNPAG